LQVALGVTAPGEYVPDKLPPLTFVNVAALAASAVSRMPMPPAAVAAISRIRT
jgi:hypothetical protein